MIAVPSRKPSRRSLKWTKLHREVWRSAELRACGVVARMLWVDLLALCDPNGRIATPDGRRPNAEQLAAMTTLGEPAVSIESALAALAAWGFVHVEEHGIVVVSAEEDAKYRDSRKAGGEARQGRSGKDAEHLRSMMLSKKSASPSGPSGSSSGSLFSGSGDSDSGDRTPDQKTQGTEKPKGRGRAKPVVVDPATMPLPPNIDTPAVREAITDFVKARIEKGHGPWTETIAKVRVAELASWGPLRAVAALRHSTGYQGVFEPKNASSAGAAAQAPKERTYRTLEA